MTPEELNVLYKSVGECVWHVQYLEDALHTLLVLKIDIREPGRVSSEEASQLLAKHRRATLGTALKSASENKVIPSEILSKLQALKTERDWMIHRSMQQDGQGLYTDQGRAAVFMRLEELITNSISLKQHIIAEIKSFCTERGVSEAQVEAIALKKVALLKGDL